MNAEISETMGARPLRFAVQIPELLTQRKFVSVECHAHSNAHKPPKTVAPSVLMLEGPDNAEEVTRFIDRFITTSGNDPEIHEVIQYQRHKHSASCLRELRGQQF